MTGYHYTSWKNWERIQREGLKPYPMRNPSLKGILPRDLRVIWVFQQWKPGEIAHYGQVLWSSMHRHTLHIALLAVDYEESDIYTDGPPGSFNVSHNGELSTGYGEPWVYHVREPAHLLIHPVPPERIRLLADYDLKALIDRMDSAARFTT